LLFEKNNPPSTLLMIIKKTRRTRPITTLSIGS